MYDKGSVYVYEKGSVHITKECVYMHGKGSEYMYERGIDTVYIVLKLAMQSQS